MLNKTDIKEISYTCPRCQQQIVTFVDTSEFQDKEFPVVITDIHGSSNDKHANTLYLDENFVIRAVEASDVTSSSVEEEPVRNVQKVKEMLIPIPKEKVKLSNLGYIERLLVKAIDGEKTTEELASELQLPEKRVKLLINKLFVEKHIKKIKRVIK
ncbi:MAG: hypothetical protein GF308_08360 [Candidatus Heimdallarchaeota archaeon]|nr:hypothetical protein [Candidatus Heimdallarchaeota archaeon]